MKSIRHYMNIINEATALKGAQYWWSRFQSAAQRVGKSNDQRFMLAVQEAMQKGQAVANFLPNVEDLLMRSIEQAIWAKPIDWDAFQPLPKEWRGVRNGDANLEWYFHDLRDVVALCAKADKNHQAKDNQGMTYYQRQTQQNNSAYYGRG